jgi:hypothetical protein
VIRNTFRTALLFSLTAAISIGFVLANYSRRDNGARQEHTDPADQDNTAAIKAFADVARVLRHQRCLNCHPNGDRPRVGDDRIVHRMNVQRGPENKGMDGLHCSACHQTENQPGSGVPGAPTWHLAPLSMAWEGLDDHQLAQALIDRDKNGDKSHEQLLEHVAEDPLVGWGWEPGEGRSLPPLSREEFVAAFKTWLDAGAPLPPKGKTSY